jgi:hypothetical protein
MDTITTLIAINLHGIRLRVDNGRLLAEPKDALTDELRALIRQSRAALVELLEPAEPGADSLQDYCAALHLGRLVACGRCQHYTATPAEQPDGVCDHHGPVWSNVVFDCPEYIGRRTGSQP